MRIVSWNLGSNSVSNARHDAAWRLLLDPAGLNADVALVQEAVVPDGVSKTHHVHWRRAWPNSHGHNWGTGIIASREYHLTPVERVVPDTRYVMARLAAAGRDFVMVSVHAFTTMRPDYFDDHRALTSVERLQANFDAIRSDCTGRFIVGGDLNTGRIAELTWLGNGHASFWARLDEAGFRSCPWSQTGEELTTFKHPSGPFIGQADHILLDSATASEATIDTMVPDLGNEFSDQLLKFPHFRGHLD